MTPAELSRTVVHAVCRAVEDGALRVAVPDRVRIERPRPGGVGDWATNAALTLAGPAGRPPREVAEILRTRILADGDGDGDGDGAPGRCPDDGSGATPGPGAARPAGPTRSIERIDITGPGFLNFTLTVDGAGPLVRTILRAGVAYGHGDALAGTAVVFARPSGIRARVWTGAVVGLLRSQGARASVAPGPEPGWTVPGPDSGGGAGAERGPAVGPHTGPLVEAPQVVPAAEDIVERLGRDAARWALLRTAAHDRPPTGGGLLVQREGNPLFRVRYAHARTRALARNAAQHGIDSGYDVPPDAWVTPDGPALIAALGDYPALLESAARLRAPDRLARHLDVTADAFLRFQQTGRPLPMGDEKPSAAHRARLALAEATGTVLAGGLSLLGIDAPRHL